MAIIAAAGSSFTPCPPGVHQAVCVDVIDHGNVEVSWQGQTKVQHKISIVWQVEELMEDHKPYQVRKRYTLTLSDKGNLRKDLESWRGRAFTAEELRGFDVERLIGINCLLNVTHNTNGDKTYANVTAVMPVKRGMPPLSAVDYVRAKDRPTESAGGASLQTSNGHDDPFGDMDNVPF